METFRPKHIALDFYNTLAYLEGGRECIFDLFRKFGVSPQKVEEAYESTKKDGGFNIDRLIHEVERGAGEVVDGEVVRLDFAKWLGRSLKLYPDAKELLARIKKQGA